MFFLQFSAATLLIPEMSNQREMVVDTMSRIRNQCIPQEICHVVADFLDPLFKDGDLVDCKDPGGKWYLAKVLHISPDGNKTFITYPGWPQRWNEWIDPLNDGKISRIYMPDSKACLEEIQVGDKVDYFEQRSPRNHVHECEVTAVLSDVVKLKDVVPCCKNSFFKRTLEFFVAKDVGVIRRIPTHHRRICQRKIK
jgi:hypothetical protein